jgi:hypothetical protein
MSGPVLLLPCRRPGAAATNAAVAALLVLLALLAPAVADADRTLRLTSAFQGRAATTLLTVPDDWRGAVRGDQVKLTAPSSRKGCDHLLRLRLGMLYVASTVTSPDWVAGRLADQGPILASGIGEYSWGVAARKGRRTSVGAGAVVAGTGRFGRIMAELRGTTALTRRCTTAQSGQAAKRLARVLQSAVVQTVERSG